MPSAIATPPDCFCYHAGPRLNAARRAALCQEIKDAKVPQMEGYFGVSGEEKKRGRYFLSATGTLTFQTYLGTGLGATRTPEGPQHDNGQPLIHVEKKSYITVLIVRNAYTPWVEDAAVEDAAAAPAPAAKKAGKKPAPVPKKVTPPAPAHDEVDVVVKQEDTKDDAAQPMRDTRFDGTVTGMDALRIAKQGAALTAEFAAIVKAEEAHQAELLRAAGQTADESTAAADVVAPAASDLEGQEARVEPEAATGDDEDGARGGERASGESQVVPSRSHSRSSGSRSTSTDSRSSTSSVPSNEEYSSWRRRRRSVTPPRRCARPLSRGAGPRASRRGRSGSSSWSSDSASDDDDDAPLSDTQQNASTVQKTSTPHAAPEDPSSTAVTAEELIIDPSIAPLDAAALEPTDAVALPVVEWLAPWSQPSPSDDVDGNNDAIAESISARFGLDTTDPDDEHHHGHPHASSGNVAAHASKSALAANVSRGVVAVTERELTAFIGTAFDGAVSTIENNSINNDNVAAMIARGRSNVTLPAETVSLYALFARALALRPTDGISLVLAALECGLLAALHMLPRDVLPSDSDEEDEDDTAKAENDDKKIQDNDHKNTGKKKAPSASAPVFSLERSVLEMLVLLRDLKVRIDVDAADFTKLSPVAPPGIDAKPSDTMPVTAAAFVEKAKARVKSQQAPTSPVPAEIAGVLSASRGTSSAVVIVPSFDPTKVLPAITAAAASEDIALALTDVALQEQIPALAFPAGRAVVAFASYQLSSFCREPQQHLQQQDEDGALSSTEPSGVPTHVSVSITNPAHPRLLFTLYKAADVAAAAGAAGDKKDNDDDDAAVSTAGSDDDKNDDGKDQAEHEESGALESVVEPARPAVWRLDGGSGGSAASQSVLSPVVAKSLTFTQPATVGVMRGYSAIRRASTSTGLLRISEFGADQSPLQPYAPYSAAEIAGKYPHIPLRLAAAMAASPFRAITQHGGLLQDIVNAANASPHAMVIGTGSDIADFNARIEPAMARYESDDRRRAVFNAAVSTGAYVRQGQRLTGLHSELQKWVEVELQCGVRIHRTAPFRVSEKPAHVDGRVSKKLATPRASTTNLEKPQPTSGSTPTAAATVASTTAPAVPAVGHRTAPTSAPTTTKADGTAPSDNARRNDEPVLPTPTGPPVPAPFAAPRPSAAKTAPETTRIFVDTTQKGPVLPKPKPEVDEWPEIADNSDALDAKLPVFVMPTEHDTDAARKFTTDVVPLPPLPNSFVGRSAEVLRMMNIFERLVLWVSRMCLVTLGAFGRKATVLAVAHKRLRIAVPPSKANAAVRPRTLNKWAEDVLQERREITFVRHSDSASESPLEFLVVPRHWSRFVGAGRQAALAHFLSTRWSLVPVPAPLADKHLLLNVPELTIGQSDFAANADEFSKFPPTAADADERVLTVDPLVIPATPDVTSIESQLLVIVRKALRSLGKFPRRDNVVALIRKRNSHASTALIAEALGRLHFRDELLLFPWPAPGPDCVIVPFGWQSLTKTKQWSQRAADMLGIMAKWLGGRMEHAQSALARKHNQEDQREQRKMAREEQQQKRPRDDTSHDDVPPSGPPPPPQRFNDDRDDHHHLDHHLDHHLEHQPLGQGSVDSSSTTVEVSTLGRYSSEFGGNSVDVLPPAAGAPTSPTLPHSSLGPHPTVRVGVIGHPPPGAAPVSMPAPSQPASQPQGPQSPHQPQSGPPQQRAQSPPNSAGMPPPPPYHAQHLTANQATGAPRPAEIAAPVAVAAQAQPKPAPLPPSSVAPPPPLVPTPAPFTLGPKSLAWSNYWHPLSMKGGSVPWVESTLARRAQMEKSITTAQANRTKGNLSNALAIEGPPDAKEADITQLFAYLAHSQFIHGVRLSRAESDGAANAAPRLTVTVQLRTEAEVKAMRTGLPLGIVAAVTKGVTLSHRTIVIKGQALLDVLLETSRPGAVCTPAELVDLHSTQRPNKTATAELREHAALQSVIGPVFSTFGPCRLDVVFDETGVMSGRPAKIPESPADGGVDIDDLLVFVTFVDATLGVADCLACLEAVQGIFGNKWGCIAGLPPSKLTTIVGELFPGTGRKK